MTSGLQPPNRVRLEDDSGVFDARAWVAAQLGVPAQDLALARERIDNAGRTDAIYYRNGSFAAQVLISVVQTHVRHRLVEAIWPDGTTEGRIGLHEEVILRGVVAEDTGRRYRRGRRVR